MLKGFKEFVLRGNVVDLAVAVVIGAAFGAVVTALVTDIITPLVAAIGGQHDFSDLTFKIHNSTFRYGAFINAVISFVIIAAAIYFIVVLPLNKLAERRSALLARAQLLLGQQGEILESSPPSNAVPIERGPRFQVIELVFERRAHAAIRSGCGGTAGRRRYAARGPPRAATPSSAEASSSPILIATHVLEQIRTSRA